MSGLVSICKSSLTIWITYNFYDMRSITFILLYRRHLISYLQHLFLTVYVFLNVDNRYGSKTEFALNYSQLIPRVSSINNTCYKNMTLSLYFILFNIFSIFSLKYC